MTSTRFAIPLILLLAAALLAPASILPAVIHDAPAATTLPTTPAPLPPEAVLVPAGIQPHPGITTVEIPIAAGSDDAGPNPASAWPSPNGCEYGTGWNEVYFGVCGSGAYVVSGFRFTNVPVPPAAHIVGAHLRFTLDSYVNEEITVRFYGEAAGNAATFTATDRPEDRPVNTLAFGEWYVPASEVWTLGDQRNSPDLTAVVQTIIDRPDWRAGNALAIIARSIPPASGYWHSRRVIGFERPSWYAGREYAARLVLSYEIAPPTPTPTPTPPPTAGVILGTIWHDLDGAGARDAGEPGLAGVQVCAEPLGHRAVRCATSGADGGYAIAVDATGTYLVAPSAAPAGMQRTTPGFRLPVAVRVGQQVWNVDFGYR